jgi:hypothetical protein
MASQTERPQVSQVAFAAAFGHRHNVIRIPETLPRNPFQTPVRQQLHPLRSTRTFQIAVRRLSVYAALRADAVIAQTNVLAKVAWVRAELPFMHAVFGAERKAPGWHFQTAPAAQRALIVALLESVSIRETAVHGS